MVNATITQPETLMNQLSPVFVPAEEQADTMTLHNLLNTDKVLKPFQIIAPNGNIAIIPQSMFDIWEQVAQIMAGGDFVSVVSISKELTLEQAAELLNESMFEIETLIEDSELPFILRGDERRFRTEDVLAYKRERYERRREGLSELTRLTELYGGYDTE